MHDPSAHKRLFVLRSNVSYRIVSRPVENKTHTRALFVFSFVGGGGNKNIGQAWKGEFVSWDDFFGGRG